MNDEGETNPRRTRRVDAWRPEREQTSPDPTHGNAKQGGGSAVQVERIVAAVSGAAEGIAEGLERYHLAEESKEALAESGRLVRDTTGEVRHQLGSPEGEAMRRGARRGSERFAARAEQTQEQVGEMVDRAEHKIDDLRTMVQEKATMVQGRAEDIRETTHRSREAVPAVWEDVTHAMKTSVTGVAASVGGYAVAGVVGVVSAVILSAGLVVAFNLLLGAPWGYFVTAAIYAGGAAFLVAGARSTRRSHQAEARHDMEDARHEIEHAAEPLRTSAGSNGQSTGSAPAADDASKIMIGRRASRQT